MTLFFFRSSKIFKAYSPEDNGKLFVFIELKKLYNSVFMGDVNFILGIEVFPKYIFACGVKKLFLNFFYIRIACICCKFLFYFFDPSHQIEAFSFHQ